LILAFLEVDFGLRPFSKKAFPLALHGLNTSYHPQRWR
jgi:hypothetical protein